MQELKIVSFKVLPGLWKEFRIACIRKDTNPSEEFRKFMEETIITHTNERN